jgi:hypothetical protein
MKEAVEVLHGKSRMGEKRSLYDFVGNHGYLGVSMSSFHGLLGDDRPPAVADGLNGVLGIRRRHDGRRSARARRTALSP